MMSLWDALRMNMMISYQELVRTFPNILISRSGEVQDKSKHHNYCLQNNSFLPVRNVIVESILTMI